MLTRISMKLFADDTTLYFEIYNQNNKSIILNNDLENIQHWADQWLIKFSPSKTKLMTCSFRKINYQPIRFKNVMLASGDSHKHLGLNVSSNLTWTSHIDSILISVSAMCDVVNKLKYDVDRHPLERA